MARYQNSRPEDLQGSQPGLGHCGGDFMVQGEENILNNKDQHEQSSDLGTLYDGNRFIITHFKRVLSELVC